MDDLDANGYAVLSDNIEIADKIVELSGNYISRDEFTYWLIPKITQQGKNPD